MRSRGERVVAGALAAVAGGVAARWTADRWKPHAGPWAAQMWRKATRLGPDALPWGKAVPVAPSAVGAASAPPSSNCAKCVKDGKMIYTDQPCPSGSRGLAVDGAVTT